MGATIPADVFRSELFDVLTEVFERVQGILLDKGTSLFETLDGVDAEVASRPVSAGCASIAAQVEHTAYYLDVAEVYARGERPEGVDWDASWRRVTAVTPEEWDALKGRLRASYDQIRATIGGRADFAPDDIGGAIGMVAHSAYHLGEIRQALCTVRG